MAAHQGELYTVALLTTPAPVTLWVLMASFLFMSRKSQLSWTFAKYLPEKLNEEVSIEYICIYIYKFVFAHWSLKCSIWTLQSVTLEVTFQDSMEKISWKCYKTDTYFRRLVTLNRPYGIWWLYQFSSWP